MKRFRLFKILRSIKPSGSGKDAIADASPCNHVQDKGNAYSTIDRYLTTCNDLPVELLQHIFSCLDFTALLKCRCVSQGWFECIPADSRELRMTMFIPSPTIPTSFISRPYTLYIDIHTDAKSSYSRRRSAKVANICNINKSSPEYLPRRMQYLCTPSYKTWINMSLQESPHA